MVVSNHMSSFLKELQEYINVPTIKFDFAAGLPLGVLGQAPPLPKVGLAHVGDADLHLHVVEGGLTGYLGQLVLALSKVWKERFIYMFAIRVC